MCVAGLFESVDASGAVTTFTASGVIELLNLTETHQLHALNKELSNTHSPLDLKDLYRVVVNKAHFNLSAVLRINGSWRVDHGNPMLSCQAGPRVDQADGAHRQGKGYTRADQSPLAGAQSDIVRSVEIRTGIATVGALRQRKLLIKAFYLNLTTRTYRNFEGMLLIHAAQPTLSLPYLTLRLAPRGGVYSAYWVLPFPDD